MIKRLVVYSIEDEAVRSNFEAAIHGIDPDCRTLILDHCILFLSDQNLIDLASIVPGLPIDTIDEIFFFEITGQAVGFVEATTWLSQFMNS